jgi:hypothetical protein
MPSPVLTTAATIMCPHGGQAVLVTTNATVMVGGAPALTMADVHMIAGCAFFIGPKPSPCLRIQWVSGSTLVTVNGVPVLTQASIGLCLSPEQAPQGPPVIAFAGQTTVLA